MSTSIGPSHRRAALAATLASRRTFLKGLLAAGASTLITTAGVVARPTTALAARKPMAFAFDHDDSTTILIDRAAEPTRLDIEVRSNGVTVERFENADPYRLHKLHSAYFSTVYFDPPAP